MGDYLVSYDEGSIRWPLVEKLAIVASLSQNSLSLFTGSVHIKRI
jgi:hypothetical protein